MLKGSVIVLNREIGKIRNDVSLLTDLDIHLFREGSHYKLYEKMGAHFLEIEKGITGVYFALWAPNAEYLSIMGNFNGWSKESHQLKCRSDHSGIWEGFIPGLCQGDIYKFHIRSKYKDYEVDKGDPFSFYWEVAPRTASIVWELDYSWGDTEWMGRRGKLNSPDSPCSVYELHLGSWRRGPEGEFMNYRDLAPLVAQYVKELGFTHVELLPVMEHPFYGSWGYQTLGYFAPTSRYGTPQDFMYFVDILHQNGIGVILDWVPSHFPNDEYGLSYFDGTHLFEHEDPRKGFHPDWKSAIFNYGRKEVLNFLISSALFWLDKYHIDGLRIDAVASMLYLDYSRKQGEWIPNEHGGRENLEALHFLRRLNEAVYRDFPGAQTIAEESTSWPMVTKPVSVGGLGFGMKWNMGWMNDTLQYFSKDPIHRKYHHNQLTFSIWYAFSENFLLSLSHDEVVYGKGSLINKMPGDRWRKFANLRLMLGYMFTHPGKKLLFMGCEFAQWNEWDHEKGLEWELLEQQDHQAFQRWLRDLNNLYTSKPALFEGDFDESGFRWIDCGDSEQSVITYLRQGKCKDEYLLVACNFTPVPRNNYRIGTPVGGEWKEILNSDSEHYGGSGQGNFGALSARDFKCHGMSFSIEATLPPLGMVVFEKGKRNK